MLHVIDGLHVILKLMSDAWPAGEHEEAQSPTLAEALERQLVLLHSLQEKSFEHPLPMSYSFCCVIR